MLIPFVKKSYGVPYPRTIPTFLHKADMLRWVRDVQGKSKLVARAKRVLKPKLKKSAGVGERLLEIAMPLSHSPGTQATLMSTGLGLIYGKRMAIKSLQKGKQIAQRLKLKRRLKLRSDI